MDRVYRTAKSDDHLRIKSVQLMFGPKEIVHRKAPD